MRIGWVDAAKGFSMLCIILGHFCAFFMNYLEFAQVGFQIIGTFQVPLFFLLSGYTMNAHKWMGLGGIKKLAQRCFLPYIFAGICSIIMCLIFVDSSRLYDFVFGFFYGAGAYRDHILFGDTSHVSAIGLIWFLPALFVGKIITSALSRFTIYVRLLITGILFLVGGITAPILFLPFGLQEGMCAAWYMTVGIWMKETGVFGEARDIEAEHHGRVPLSAWINTHMSAIVATVATLFGCYYVVSILSGWAGLPMYCNSTYHQPFFDMFGTACVCIALTALVKLLVSTCAVADKALTWCGLYSMGLFIFHAITLSPGDNVKWWIYRLVEDGAEPTGLFFLLLGINLFLVFGLTFASKYIKPLRWILYGSKAPTM